MNRRSLMGVSAAAIRTGVAFFLAGGLLACRGQAVRSVPALALPSGVRCGSRGTPPAYHHLILIVMENQSFGDIYQARNAPYVNELAAACGLAANYHSITHDSLPNYLALTNGADAAALAPFDNDCLPAAACRLQGVSIFDETASHGGWKAYEESMPQPCDRRDSGQYAPKHNPAVYYTDLDAACGTDDIALGAPAGSALLKDFSNDASAPAVAFVTPNLCDDMHGGSGCHGNLVQVGDGWLATWIPLVANTAVYSEDSTAVFVVWDEGAGGSAGENCAANAADESCHVPALVIAPSVPPGSVAAARFDHYSLLKTIEDLLGLPALGQAARASSMAPAFNLATAGP